MVVTAIKGLGKAYLVGRRTVAAQKAAGKTRKIIKTYSTGRRQTEYVRPGQPEYKMKPKMGKSGTQGKLFSERHPPKKKDKQLKFKFSFEDRKRPLQSLKKAIKKSEVK